MKQVVNAKLTKGYEHWKSEFETEESRKVRSEAGITIIGYGWSQEFICLQKRLRPHTTFKSAEGNVSWLDCPMAVQFISRASPASSILQLTIMGVLAITVCKNWRSIL